MRLKPNTICYNNTNTYYSGVPKSGIPVMYFPFDADVSESELFEVTRSQLVVRLQELADTAPIGSTVQGAALELVEQWSNIKG